MRARFATSVVVLGGTLAACSLDLFHSTDFDTLCDVDPTTDGCAPNDATTSDAPGTTPDAARDAFAPDGAPLGDSGGTNDGTTPPSDSGHDAGPTNFCAWSSATAHANARHACAWLGACVGALGENDFGQCLDDALFAYDCTIAPGRAVLGAAHTYWDCLWQATTCAEVVSCVTSGKGALCGTFATEITECATAQDVTYDCASTGGFPLAITACFGAGKRCDVTPGTTTYCAANPGACPGTAACVGTKVFDCNGGAQDLGVDCALVGAGTCTNAAGVGPACVPSAGTACAPDASIDCLNTVATGCPAGRRETVDCVNLVEQPSTCAPSTPGRVGDVGRACTTGTACTPGCGADGGLAACHRGAYVPVACGAYGLKPCETVVHAGSVTTYQCAPP